jgi:peptide/nickel transport system permease protein
LQRQGVLDRFVQNRLAAGGLVVIVLLVVGAALGPFLLTHDANTVDVYNTFLPPGSPGHPLGTDDLGRDVLARLVAGGRISLALGLSVALVAAAVGTMLGAMAGFYRGLVDAAISRIIDILLAVPQLALLMVISGFVRVKAQHLALVMALLGWMGVARLVRGEVLSLRETEFVLAARTIGANGTRIILRHLLPNVVAPVTVAATLAVAWTILIESALSYLGFGVHPPTATWGNMLQGAQRYMRTAPWLAILPGILIGVTVTCFNLVGDGLREAVDPRLKGRAA